MRPKTIPDGTRARGIADIRLNGRYEACLLEGEVWGGGG